MPVAARTWPTDASEARATSAVGRAGVGSAPDRRRSRTRTAAAVASAPPTPAATSIVPTCACSSTRPRPPPKRSMMPSAACRCGAHAGSGAPAHPQVVGARALALVGSAVGVEARQDDAGVDLSQVCGRQSQPGQRVDRAIVHDHVGPPNQLLKGRATGGLRVAGRVGGRRAHVHPPPLLSAHQDHGLLPAHLGRVGRARRVDLDDVGSEPGEHGTDGGAGNHVCEIEHRQPAQPRTGAAEPAPLVVIPRFGGSGVHPARRRLPAHRLGQRRGGAAGAGGIVAADGALHRRGIRGRAAGLARASELFFDDPGHRARPEPPPRLLAHQPRLAHVGRVEPLYCGAVRGARDSRGAKPSLPLVGGACEEGSPDQRPQGGRPGVAHLAGAQAVPRRRVPGVAVGCRQWHAERLDLLLDPQHLDGILLVQRLKVVERGRPRVAQRSLAPRPVDGGHLVLKRVVYQSIEKRARERHLHVELEAGLSGGAGGLATAEGGRDGQRRRDGRVGGSERERGVGGGLAGKLPVEAHAGQHAARRQDGRLPSLQLSKLGVG
eukprot:scaffold5708_cov107-Isochrysis_galbana.AAC.22